ncbi:transcript variant X1 [Nothobranchius furzeri]|uniref:Solute carrier family 2, facilitated glucose transporter member 5 n=1 Tax=Nothobranchius furzeri TaxID=105023 RepID=A0A9D2XTG1_NOTFU|nr:transcript variant X1 [Nothobranchius furzeri]
METLVQQLTKGTSLFLIITLGLGGSFQNGYHLTSPSSPSPYIQRFINSSWYDRYSEPPHPQTVTMIWSLVVSMYAVGGLFGAASVNFISRRLGRKKAIICSSLISIVGMVTMLTSKYANTFEMIIVARILYGYSSGLGGSIHLIYLGEISPRRIRGPVTLTYVIFLSLGKLSGQIFGLSEILGREDMWNVLLSVPACFSLAQVAVLPFLPEAPRYLFIEKRDDEACKKALQRLWGKGEYKQEMEEMLTEQLALEAAHLKSLLQLLKDRAARWQLITMSIIGYCNQLSGTLAISTFAFDVFLEVGIPKDDIRYATLGLGVSEILTSIFCGFLIELTGRRPLLWRGYAVTAACWILVTITLNLKDLGPWIPYVTATLIFLFQVSFRGGPGMSFTVCTCERNFSSLSSETVIFHPFLVFAGAVASTLRSELFVQSDRLAAFVLMGLQCWFLIALLGLVFPFIINSLGSYCFVLFGCVCLLGSLYTFFLLPETKGKTLLEISEEFKAITVCGKSFSEEKKVETRL